jgi:hypothetical protein
MAIKHRTYSVSVTTTAVRVCTADPKRKHLKILETLGVTAYLTDAQNKAATEGYPVSSTLPFETDHGQGEYWAITAAGTASLRVEDVGES